MKTRNLFFISRPARRGFFRGPATTSALLFLILALVGSGLAATGTGPWTGQILSSKAISRLRSQPVVPVRARQYLADRTDSTVLIWVFFTDKGLDPGASLESQASSALLTERALRRRAKVNLDHVVFADVPVDPAYVARITAAGAIHRRSSRWLNAASFEISPNLLDRIAGLPFVAEIRPVAGFRRDYESTTDIKTPAPDATLSPSALDYGLSEAQLNQLNVPAVHDRGYSGAGVTLTITDTGFRKSHDAFAMAYAESRVLAEYDFVFNDTNVANETGDWASAWNHGTSVWSLAGGYDDGVFYGPAYGANFILCKTEDVRSETPVEEDNWVAALEFADSIGTDVITTSLGYSDWYTYSDLDGRTAVISIAAGTCDGLGIVMCNSMGNDGPSLQTLTAPADAFDILSIGAVSITGTIASFSSRGPTYDGRIKPDLCARGLSDNLASASGDAAYATGNGTSFATPLIAGAVCLIIEAHPGWRPSQVREALRQTGNHANLADNIYGWGVPDVNAALDLSPTCCSGKTGDVNGYGGDRPTIGDVMTLIDHLFISEAPLDCLPEADVNRSGFVWPGYDDITIQDVNLLIDVLFIGSDTLPDCFEEYQVR